MSAAMLEFKCKLTGQKQAAFQTVILLNPNYIVSVFAPYGSRNLGCSVLTTAGIVYDIDEGYDAVKKRLYIEADRSK